MKLSTLITKFKLMSLGWQLTRAGFTKEAEGDIKYWQISDRLMKVEDRELNSILRRIESSTIEPWAYVGPTWNPCIPKDIYIKLENPVEATNPNDGKKYCSQRYHLFVRRRMDEKKF